MKMSYPGTAGWELQQTANGLTPAEVGFPLHSLEIWRALALPAAPNQTLLSAGAIKEE